MIEILRQISLLSGFSKEQLERIKEISIVRNYSKGTTLFNPAQTAEGFYILTRGRVKICNSTKGTDNQNFLQSYILWGGSKLYRNQLLGLGRNYRGQ